MSLIRLVSYQKAIYLQSSNTSSILVVFVKNHSKFISLKSSNNINTCLANSKDKIDVSYKYDTYKIFCSNYNTDYIVQVFQRVLEIT